MNAMLELNRDGSPTVNEYTCDVVAFDECEFADELLLKLLEELGYGRTAEAFRKLPKWYA